MSTTTWWTHTHCTNYQGTTSAFDDISAGSVSYDVKAGNLYSITPGIKLVKYADDAYLIILGSNVDSKTSELKHIDDWT